jgi:hypothetical protein
MNRDQLADFYPTRKRVGIMGVTTSKFARKASAASRLLSATGGRLAALRAGAVSTRYGAPPPESERILVEDDEDLRVTIALLCAAYV